MPKKGYKQTPEHKEKIKQRVITDEWRENNRKAQTGKKMSPEARVNMSIASSKRKHSPETLEKLRGSNSHLWKGGVSSENYKLRHNVQMLLEYRNWRKDIYRRDGYTCQECGQVGGELNAHHITHFQMIVDMYNITTAEEARDCEAMWDLDNGITLCKNCHNGIHFKPEAIKILQAKAGL